ncbi:protein POLLEN DEFECTIVE IN GUIDANCE 1 isoform X4 [Physcomitrium patens]|uniref:protein POLLEN DEFECTIVE IN GUIDANCE 1 isoform X4 n=1 Tax=Physcomitrium patens TaxID=3218 RepID=UPI000D1652AC|nr:protein POLLEN DEFECTIVE IN GUIDANCE 1-like isoform X4 [Physcomitrium patens]|eukprot:XP_024391066.1 protein POLLEN DEFECTIVE IN GUIDANCE 1-like isoform X4 [Physcomitrella patens]
MDNYGRRRRTGVYELLTVDTSGDDEEVGRQEEQSLPPTAKIKGKRRKHKHRKMGQNIGFEMVLGEKDLGDVAEENELGQNSLLITENLRNLASGVPGPGVLHRELSLKSRSVETLISHGLEDKILDFGSEIRPEFVSSYDKIYSDNALNDGCAPDLRLSLPIDQSAGQTSLVAPDFNIVSGYSPRGGQREPMFAPGQISTELRQRAVEKLPSSPVQGNGVEKHPIPRLVSLKMQKPDADPSYPGHVDVVEQSLGSRVPPLPRPLLSSYETPHLTEWERLMAANSEYPAVVGLSPINYLREEFQRGSLSERHPSHGIQQRRERIYNTMFHVPWRCELLIDVGFFVCLDSFLSLFTVMPARIIMFLWQRILHWRQFQRPYAAELSDFASLIILVLGVAVLQQADISFIYHYIRGQATIKLYVVFNVLEIFDKLCQSFGGDVLQILLNSAVAIGDSPPERLIKQWAQFILDQSIAIVSFLVHSLVIMSQAITVSAAINSQNNALLTLLISNNFAEIKSNVFKRVAKENLHKMAYHDTVERFHIMAHLLFVLAQNIQNSEDTWLWNFAYNAGMVVLCEVLVDVIKHSFLAKFNEIKPSAYSEFLQALCKQTLNSHSHEVHKTLHFVPLAPACVVLRVLIPLYATFLPQGPLLHRVVGIIILGGGTYIILLALKILVGLGLQMHAAWYLKRCKHKEGHHLHAD